MTEEIIQVPRARYVLDGYQEMTKYTTKDGKIFYNKEEAEEYEFKINAFELVKNIKKKIINKEIWYFLQHPREAKIIAICENCILGNYKKNETKYPNWFLADEIDGGDSRNDINFYSMDDKIQEAENELNKLYDIAEELNCM